MIKWLLGIKMKTGIEIAFVWSWKFQNITVRDGARIKETHGIHGLFLTCEKINTCYYTDTTCTWKETMIAGHRRYVWSKSVNVALQNSTYTLNNVHTWTSVFLRHLASTSFMVPFWAYTELSSAPILASVYLVATLVQRMLFIALMTAAQVSPNVFCPLGGFPLCTSEHHIIIHGTQHTFFIHHIHA